MSHVVDNRYLLTAVPSYSLSCPRKGAGAVVTEHPGCLSCVVSVNQNCKYDDGKYHILPLGAVGQRLGDRLTGNTTTRHRLNMPLLSKFLNESDLVQLYCWNPFQH